MRADSTADGDPINVVPSSSSSSSGDRDYEPFIDCVAMYRADSGFSYVFASPVDAEPPSRRRDYELGTGRHLNAALTRHFRDLFSCDLSFKPMGAVVRPSKWTHEFNETAFEQLRVASSSEPTIVIADHEPSAPKKRGRKRKTAPSALFAASTRMPTTIKVEPPTVDPAAAAVKVEPQPPPVRRPRGRPRRRPLDPPTES